LQADDQKVVLPIMYGALGAWWAFIVYRIVRTIRRRALPGAYLTAQNWKRDLLKSLIVVIALMLTTA